MGEEVGSDLGVRWIGIEGEGEALEGGEEGGEGRRAVGKGFNSRVRWRRLAARRGRRDVIRPLWESSQWCSESERRDSADDSTMAARATNPIVLAPQVNGESVKWKGGVMEGGGFS